VTLDVSAIVERARIAAAQGRGSEAPGSDREKLKRIAAEFESMLLVQMLKDMRRAGSWEEEGGSDSLGAESLFETLDVELASHLSRVKGMGLSRQLEDAFNRMHPEISATPNSQLPTPNAKIVIPSSKLATPKTDAGATPEGLGAVQAPAVASGFSRTTQVAVATAKKSHPVVAALRTAAEATAAVPHAVTQMVKPVAGAVTSAFGWRQDPFTKQMKFHQGVDLRAAYGQDVQSAAAGRVVFSGEQGGYGTTVVVEHQDGTRTRYAHLSARLVKKGDAVAAGAPLGRAGHSGRAKGTHLHFEVISKDGRRVHPEQWGGGRNAPLQAAAGHADHRAEPSQMATAVRTSSRPAGKPAGVTLARTIQDRGPDAD
jgi:murein DD-endopeptidase MepM/ murein hydrolase activator NlpD